MTEDDVAPDDGGLVVTESASAAALVGSVLDEEEARLEVQAGGDGPLFADDLLPGVGGEEMPLREGLAKGGVYTFVVLTLLNSLDELEQAAMAVLGPDIGADFGVSDGTITFITAASSAFFVLGAMPLGYLADRVKRTPIVGICSLLFSFMVFLSGLAVNSFMLFWTRFGAGIAKANTIPVHGSLIADTYPIEVRGRISSTTAWVGRVMGAISPLLVGWIAIQAGGPDGWRWAYYLLGFPVAILAVAAFFMKEPERGQWEKKDVLGHSLDEADPAPISVEAAFARLWRIKTLKTVTLAFSALGFSLFGLASLTNFYLEDRFGLDALGRGKVSALNSIGVILVVPFVGRHFDRLYRKSPPSALRLVGFLLIPAGFFVAAQFLAPNIVLFTIFWGLANTCLGSAFSVVSPITNAIVPYRLRGLGTALTTLYIFLIGGIGGALIGAFFQNAYGARATALSIVPAALIIGGLTVLNGSRFIRNDLSLVVAELQEEQAEHDRQVAHPENIPAIQVKDVDFSYGSVQVLFDVEFEVHPGEVLALLGTNGAGKSTILRVISGLGTPERGVVRLDGKTVTYTTPEQRTQMGVHMLLGGKGVFNTMTVRNNLVMGAYHYRKDERDVERRINRVLELFPDLADRQDQLAGSLSGGQQQMVALARTLLHDPKVLIIDELSLGLAPVVVQELLEVVSRLKETGMTIIIVEQSLNIALAIADRAVFMEKGRVRFEGDAQELAERDDLARAVFLGTEGG